jgi:hypothetical protein
MSMTLISTVTVGSGGANPVVFSSIPSTFTDVVLQYSVRESGTAASGAGFNVYLNTEIASGTNYSFRGLSGSGSSAGSDGSSGQGGFFFANITPTTSQTSNTFNNGQIYFPNYSGSTNKSLSLDSVYENNATSAFQRLYAGLWANTAAINTISIYSGVGSYVQFSNFSLYGITKGSGGATVS